ncbi:MAG: TRAP transporter substrate-binding protein DctP, partial [Clostridiaceae bacterium]|nr:TRAP transporter substrate-binding protein DctP [Clostridiaceae bacterium]
RVHFTVHYAGSLVEGGSMLQGVSSGIADVGWCPFSYFAGELPVYNALCVGGYEWLNSKIGSYVNMDFMKAFPEELPDKLEFMFTHSTIPAALMTNKPIATKEDLKGLQIRCDTVHMDGVAALGAKPVSMTMPEAYEGLSKNIIDGVLGPTEVLIGWNLYETTKYITEAPLLYNAIPVVMFNKKAWNSLPEDIQDIIKKINDKHLEDVSTLYDEVHLEALEFGLENGLEVVKVSEEENERWKEALEPCKETYAENLNNRGLPGNEAMDKIGELVAKYKEEFAEYDESFRKEIESLIKKHQ